MNYVWLESRMRDVKALARIKDIEEDTQRFTALSEYDVRGQATVNFEVGSTKISAKDQIELKELANSATRL